MLERFACIDIAYAPAFSNDLQKLIVSSVVSRRRILQVIGISGNFAFKPLIISQATSAFFNKAAPIPPLMENDFGQPILISSASTSFAITSAPLIALSFELLPNWKTNFPET